MIKNIGVDIDFYSEDKKTRRLVLEQVRKSSNTFGTIILDRSTRRGHHFKIRLNKQVSFWQSIEIRYFLKDDLKRMFYDIMRHHRKGKIIDVLFDVKKTYKYHKLIK